MLLSYIQLPRVLGMGYIYPGVTHELAIWLDVEFCRRIEVSSCIVWHEGNMALGILAVTTFAVAMAGSFIIVMGNGMRSSPGKFQGKSSIILLWLIAALMLVLWAVS